MSFLHITCWSSLPIAFFFFFNFAFMTGFGSICVQKICMRRDNVCHMCRAFLPRAVLGGVRSVWPPDTEEEVFYQLWVTCRWKTLLQCHRQHPCWPLRFLSVAITHIPSFCIFFLILLFNICGMKNLFFSTGMKSFPSSFIEETMRMWTDQRNLLFRCNYIPSSLVFVGFFMFCTSEQWLFVSLWNLCSSLVHVKCWLGQRDQESFH